MASHQDTTHYVYNTLGELVRIRSETRRMRRCLRENRLAVKGIKRNLKRVKRMNQAVTAVNQRVQDLVNQFLIMEPNPGAAQNDNVLQTTNPLMEQAIQGINDLNLDGNNTVNPENEVIDGGGGGAIGGSA